MNSQLIAPPLNRIDVILRTTSPWHEAYPENSVKDEKENKLTSYTLKKRIGGSHVPYFASNGLRGNLRRKARDILLPYLTAASGPVSIDLFNGLSCGASSGNPENTNSIEELVRAADHIYMGLFGGGTRLFSSKFQSSDINVICKALIDNHIVSINENQRSSVESLFGHVFGQTPLEPWQFSDIRHFTRADDILRGLSKGEIEKINGGTEAIANYYSGVEANQTARKESKNQEQAVKKSTLSHLINLEVIPENTPLHFSLTFSPDITEAQLGLLIMSLEGMLQRNYFGGFGRMGFGKSRVEYLSLNSETWDVDIKKSGDDLYNSDGGFVLSSEFNGLKEAAVAEIESLNREELESFFKDTAKLKKGAA